MTINIRKTREDEAREVEVRDTEWQEPSILEMPPAPPGFVHRWVRVMLDGKDDHSNISKKLSEGYVFVKHDELDARWQHIAKRDSGRYEGYVGVGDVALAKLPLRTAQARQKHYEQRAIDQETAINKQLGKLNDARMPVYNESKSRAAVGRHAQMED